MEASFIRRLERLSDCDREYGLLYAERRKLIRNMKLGNGSEVYLRNKEKALSASLSAVKIRLNKRVAKLNSKPIFYAARKHHLTLIRKHLAFRDHVHVRADVFQMLDYYARGDNINLDLMVIED